MTGIPFGPIDPNDPEMSKALANVISSIEAEEEAKVQANKMRAEMRMMEMRSWVESLDDNQLPWLRKLMGGLAIEGRDNYQTAFFHGVLTATEWTRDDKIDPDVRFAHLDAAIGKAHYIKPVYHENDEPWAEEDASGTRDALADDERDKPDDAA